MAPAKRLSHSAWAFGSCLYAVAPRSPQACKASQWNQAAAGEKAALLVAPLNG